MASEKILKQKQAVIDEIKDRVNSATTIVLFDYHLRTADLPVRAAKRIETEYNGV